MTPVILTAPCPTIGRLFAILKRPVIVTVLRKPVSTWPWSCTRPGGWPADARDYAEAALRNYEQFGPAAADEIEETRGLLAHIEQAMRGA
jgi:hypothetical protein